MRTHVHWVWIPLLFGFHHVFLNVIAELSHMEHIANSVSVFSADLVENMLVASLVEHLKLLVQRYLRQLFCRAHSVQLATVRLLRAQTVVMLVDGTSCASPFHHDDRRKSVVSSLRGIEASDRSLLVV